MRRTIGDRLDRVAGSGDEPRLLDILGQVSRAFDRDTNNPLYARVATIYPNSWDGCTLWLPPFVSITSVQVDDDGDDTFETTLTVDTDYRVWPEGGLSNEPYHRIDANSNSATFTGWPRYQRRVKVTGIFGYSYETAATGSVVAAGGITSSVPTLTLTNSHTIDLGETLVIGSEQLDVVAKPNAATLTVTRGINGTTAAAHDADTVIYRRVYPVDAVNGMLERARYLWHNEFRGGMEPDSLGFATSSWPRWRSLVQQYAIPRGL